MPAKTTDVRQHLLTRSDLAAMSVADDRVDAWLAGGELALVDMIEEATGSTAVYAATTDSLRDQLLLLLEQHGRTDVRLGADDVRTMMVQQNEADEASKQEDVIAEHAAADELDRAIDDITHAIDDLVESNDRFPKELESTGPDDGSVAIEEAREPAVVAGETAGFALEQPEETEVVAEEPTGNEAVLDPAVRVETGTDPTTPSDESSPSTPENLAAAPIPAAAVAVDMTPVVDSLQQLHATLQQVHLAVLALGERPLPQFDASPITGALDHGFRALQQDLAAAADRTPLREGIELVRSTIESSNRAVVEALAASVSRVELPAAPTAVPAEDPPSARGFDAAAAIATVAIATGWGIAIWTFAGDARLALGAVVCANLVGCCALLLRRR